MKNRLKIVNWNIKFNILGLVFPGTLLFLLYGLNLPTAFGSVETCLGAIGPGFDATGPIGYNLTLPLIESTF